MAVTRRCEVCGNEFRTTKSTQRMCSWECRAVEHRSRVALVCAQCGKPFEVIAAIAERSRFCSRACYWASGGPALNIPRKPHAGVERYAKVYLGRINGKPKYMQRSHAVWNAAHPDDPVRRGEHIHHIDHNPRNDDIANLAKLTKRAHAQLHTSELAPEERRRRSRISAPKAAAARRIGEPKHCPVCGIEFYRPPSAKAVTCSRDCAVKYRNRRE